MATEVCKCHENVKYGVSWYDKTTSITEERYSTAIRGARIIVQEMKSDAEDGEWKETSKDHWEGSSGTYIWIYRL